MGTSRQQRKQFRAGKAGATYLSDTSGDLTELTDLNLGHGSGAPSAGSDRTSRNEPSPKILTVCQFQGDA